MNPMKRLLMASALIATALLMTGCAHRSGLIDCPSNCTVVVTLPGGQRPPSVGDNYVRVKPGTTIDFTANQDVIVLFPADTPFVDTNGDPVYWFRLNGTEAMNVRNDGSKACTNYRGCKYIVFDENDPARRALDPYIIIDR